MSPVWGRKKREQEERRERLLDGRAVGVACRLRRTTARGWGEWTVGHLALPAAGAHQAEFRADDPSAAGLVSRQAEAPVVLEGPLEVAVRTVRYKAEAFHGADAEIIIATAPRRVVEIALAPEDVEATASRLSALS